MHLPDALREKLWEQGSGREVQDGMKTGVIELLAALIYETAEMKTARPVYYTKSQVGDRKEDGGENHRRPFKAAYRARVRGAVLRQ